ncbi:glutaminase A [Alkalinema pantanalense CENA528]
MASRFQQLNPAHLHHWIGEAQVQSALGRLPDYIPLLAQADITGLAMQIQTAEGCWFRSGQTHPPFVLMSVIKPFLLLMLLETLGSQHVFAKVGKSPSGQPFHSLSQLAADRGFPRNPMINSGAITLASLLPGRNGSERCEALRQWLNQRAGCQLRLDEAMLISVRSLANEANRAIVNLLYQAGYVENIDLALETYNHICCLSGTIEDLAKLGLMLAIPHLQLQSQHQQIVNALMFTCGLYEVSGEYAVRIGLPMKSGVSGALIAVIPKEGAIAIYSPAIDVIGNSVAGLFLMGKLSQALKLSVLAID